MTDSGVITGNVTDKYRLRHPLYRWLVDTFIQDLRTLIAATQAESVYEVGCGDGSLAALILATHPCRYAGIDIGSAEIAAAERRLPNCRFVIGRAEALPEPDASFDLVLGCEVLEHLQDPAVALAELCRVSRRWVLISVPWEPLWRIANLCRGAYWSQWGNTPGHCQHFSRRQIFELARRFGRIHRLRRPFPWTMILLEIGRTA